MGRSENRDSRCVNRSKSRGSISPRILGRISAEVIDPPSRLQLQPERRCNCQSQPKMRRRVSAVIRLGFIIRASACTPAPFHRLASPDKTKRIPRVSPSSRSSSYRILFLAIIFFYEITYFPRLKGKEATRFLAGLSLSI